MRESFERIHRSNLIGMGMLPLEFMSGTDHKSLGLTGSETISIMGINSVTPGCQLNLRVVDEQGTQRDIPLHCRIDTQDELQYFQHGGILQYVLGQLAN